jgi:hypothetical protein
VQELLSLHCVSEMQQLLFGVCWQTLFALQLSIVHGLPSSGQIQGATHKLVSKVQMFEHFNVPVYPLPLTPAQVAPPNAEPSHCSVPSLIPFPQTGLQSLSLR